MKMFERCDIMGSRVSERVLAAGKWDPRAGGKKISKADQSAHPSVSVPVFFRGSKAIPAEDLLLESEKKSRLPVENSHKEILAAQDPPTC